MNPEWLAELRDIHEPLAPLWWPPAPGVWLAAIGAVAAVVLVARTWSQYRGRSRPYRTGRREYAVLERALKSGAMAPRAFADATSELLKRLLIHVEGCSEARRATGEVWLRLLAERYNEPAFVEGAGRRLGESRVRPDFDSDIEDLVALLRRTFKIMAPPPRPNRQPRRR